MAMCEKCHKTMRKDVLTRHRRNCIPHGKSMDHFHDSRSSFAQIEKARKRNG